MPRGLIFLVVVIILLIGRIFLLSRSVEEVPVQTIEADVSSNADERIKQFLIGGAALAIAIALPAIARTGRSRSCRRASANRQRLRPSR